MLVYTIAALLFLGYYNACYAEWVKYPFGNLSFQFHTEKKTWNDAKAACEASGGYLAEPSNCALDTFIRLKVKATNTQKWWIGGSDQEKEGQFKWAHSGSSVGFYTNWNKGEPNNGGGVQDCMQYWKNTQWDDVGCAVTRPYICEKAG